MGEDDLLQGRREIDDRIDEVDDTALGSPVLGERLRTTLSFLVGSKAESFSFRLEWCEQGRELNLTFVSFFYESNAHALTVVT